jgi:hypothetical protein
VKSPLRASPFRDVSSYHGRSDEFAALILEWRKRQGDVDQVVILTLAPRFILGYRVALPKASHQGWQFVIMTGRVKHRNISTDDFGSSIAIEPLGTGIPACYDTIKGLADDSVPRSFNNLRELESLLFDSLQLSDVIVDFENRWRHSLPITVQKLKARYDNFLARPRSLSQFTLPTAFSKEFGADLLMRLWKVRVQ